MTLAVLTQTIVSAPITVSKLQTGIQTALTTAGLSAYSVYNTNYQTFYYQYNTSAKGTAYLNIQVDGNGYIHPTLYDSWSTSANTGTNASYLANTSFASIVNNPNTQIVITSINHPEFRGCLLTQGSSQTVIGLFRPANIPTWWNEATYLYAFIPLSSANPTNGFGYFYPCSANPFNTSNNNWSLNFMTSSAFSNYNPNNGNNYDLITGLVLCQPTGGGYIAGSAGTTSNDLALGAASSKNLLDVWTIGSTQYTLLTQGGSPAFGIRTA